MIRPLEEKVVDKFHKELRSDLKPATRPAGINFPVLINLVPITPDKTNDVAAKIMSKNFLISAKTKTSSNYKVHEFCKNSANPAICLALGAGGIDLSCPPTWVES